MSMILTHRTYIKKLLADNRILRNKTDVDFKYHEDMRKIQDEYIESSFKAIRWLFIALCFAGVMLSVFVSIKTNKIETRLTQLEATYEISRRD